MKIFYSARQKLLFSIGLGLSAALLAWVHLENQEKKIKTRFEMATVLQAKKYIKEGKALTVELVEEVPIPAAYLQPTALQRKEELKNLQGEAAFSARIGILKGEQITKSILFEAAGLRSLAWTLSPGQTALSLSLNPQQAVAGLIQPGDCVNIYCTLDHQPGLSRDRTSLLLQRVQVVAVENRLWDPAAPMSQKPAEKNIRPENFLITLALSPQEAGLVTLAADKGRLNLALTSPLESQTHTLRPLELVDLR